MKMGCIKWALTVVAVSMALAANAFAAEATWMTDYPAALAQAKKENKLVLLAFVGSDWCEPCIIMKKRVFSTDAFKDYAAQNLVTVELDFPQEKVLSPALKKQNYDLAAKYKLMDPTDEEIKTVPVLILATPDGKQLAIEKRMFLFPAEFLGWAKKAAKKVKTGT